MERFTTQAVGILLRIFSRFPIPGAGIASPSQGEEGEEAKDAKDTQV